MQLHRAAADNAATQPSQSSGDTSSPSDQSNLDRLIQAVEVNNRQAFLKDATSAMSQAITSQVLASVSTNLAPHLANGYALVYLGNLKQSGDAVQIWKVTFKDGRDDALVKMSLNDGKLDGFFIQ
jgi:hypothetical protein